MPKREPKRHEVRIPRDPAGVCRRCEERGHMPRCNMRGNPRLHRLDLAKTRSEGVDTPGACVYYRCAGGRLVAKSNLLNAVSKGELAEMRTPDGRVVRGADATHIKPGFIDEEGNLYAYKGHNPDSGVVIPTGQNIHDY